MRFVIVGLGSIGKRHLQVIKEVYPDSVIAIWRHAKKADDTLPMGVERLCYSLDEVIAFLPDVAIVANPASKHLEVAMPLADAGVHLMIEKPLSISTDNVSDLIARCKEKKVALMVGYNLRFQPGLLNMRKLLFNGKIGDLIYARAEVGQYLPDWRPGVDYRSGVSAQHSMGGGVLLELSHEIDYLLWMLGEPKCVTAIGGKYSNLECDVEDLVEIILEYENPRRLVSIHLDMLQRSPFRKCRLVGAEGTIEWDGISDELMLYNKSNEGWHKVETKKYENRNAIYGEQLKYFIDKSQRPDSSDCEGSEGWRVLKVLDAARRSMGLGCSIDIEWGI